MNGPALGDSGPQGNPGKMGIKTLRGVTLGSTLERGPGRELSFNFMLHTFVLFEVFTSCSPFVIS